jgi:phosphoribosyl-AMP cyclohydrolase
LGTLIDSEIINSIKFKDGLVPAIIQDYSNNEVLMMAYMNKESLEKTFETGKTWFWSRSRNKLWNKGETSGHFQYVKSIKLDCDADTLLLVVEQTDAACHTGNRTCFYREIWRDTDGQ